MIEYEGITLLTSLFQICIFLVGIMGVYVIGFIHWLSMVNNIKALSYTFISIFCLNSDSEIIW